jgi:hypothetical protein
MDKVFYSELREFILDAYGVNPSFLGVYYVKDGAHVYSGTLRDDPFGVYVYSDLDAYFSVNQTMISDGMEISYSSGIMINDKEYKAWVRGKKIETLLK